MANRKWLGLPEVKARFFPSGNLQEFQRKILAAVKHDDIKAREFDPVTSFARPLLHYEWADVEYFDWEASRAWPFTGLAGDVASQVELCRADLEAYLGEGLDCPRDGRKPHGKTRNREIMLALEEICAAGDVCFERGGLTKTVERLHQKFPDYKRNSIEKMIRLRFNEQRDLRRKS